jgi:transposase
MTQAVTLLEGLPLISVIGDKSFDANAFRDYLAAAGAAIVIPPRRRRIETIPYDREAYKLRHRIECFINKIKHFRRIATRYDKTALSFFAMLCLAAAMIWLR